MVDWEEVVRVGEALNTWFLVIDNDDDDEKIPVSFKQFEPYISSRSICM